MRGKWNSLIVILCLIALTNGQQSTPQSPTYTAGVVEYQPVPGSGSPSATLLTNLDEYLNLIIRTSVDIIIFPESSLNTLETASIVPDAEDAITPCNNGSFDNLIQQLSCTASATRRYVVVNVKEKAFCSDRQQVEFGDSRCGANNSNIYNTNVVFNRNGVVVSKYRKFNLFGENGVLKPLRPVATTFTTDFGVTFGHFICFDLMFDRPALELIEQGIRDIIFTTNWFSELPFLTAVQIQQAWAFTNNVNLLAAGFNNPTVGSTGSGIYHGKFGQLASGMYPTLTRKVLIATVPKLNLTAGVLPSTPVATTPDRFTHNEMLSVYLKRDQIDQYTTQELIIPQTGNAENLNQRLCHNSFCCDFQVTAALSATPVDQVSYKYRLAAYEGKRTFDGFADGHVKVCGLFACTNNLLASCGQRFNNTNNLFSSVQFSRILVKGVITGETTKLIVPSTLDTALLPFNPNQFLYTETSNWNATSNVMQKEVTLELTQPKADILTFGVWARDFQPNSASLAVKSTMLLLVTFIIMFAR